MRLRHFISSIVVLSLPLQAEPPTYTQSSEGKYLFEFPLDSFLNFKETWSLTPDSLDQKIAVERFSKNPCIEWLDEAHTRARFGRKPFNNIDVNLSLFDRSIKVEEATLDFINGKAARFNLSLYNRGDSGEMKRDEFEKLWKQVGGLLRPKMQVKETPIVPTTTSAVKTSGYRWNAPDCTAMMEYNHLPAGGKAQAEFLRLRFASPTLAAITQPLGQNHKGAVSRGSLVKNVTHKNQDTYIQGVPMVDQGQKGYCVVASCQRMFEYLQVPCDQHELAQLAESNSALGTSPRLMEEALDKVDHKYQTRLKRLISPMEPEKKQKLNVKKFTELVKDSVNAGIPLLWALNLGEFPEDPPLSEQTAGGHMRMIIGYNESNSQLLFSDSWGAGHELKRMKIDHALDATHGLYQLIPKAL
jgi:hypothetical protein